MAVLVIFLLLALIFGIGAVIEGVLWAMLIGLALFLIAGWLAWRALTKPRARRS